MPQGFALAPGPRRIEACTLGFGFDFIPELSSRPEIGFTYVLMVLAGGLGKIWGLVFRASVFLLTGAGFGSRVLALGPL